MGGLEGAAGKLRGEDVGVSALPCSGGKPVGGGATDLSVHCAIYDLANAVGGGAGCGAPPPVIVAKGLAASLIERIICSKHQVGNNP